MLTSAPHSVTQLTFAIKDLLEHNFGQVWVEGEVSQPKVYPSGHIYFTLKDDGAQISCVIWRSTAERLHLRLEHGQQIAVRGAVQVYAPRGSYQLIVNKVELAGEGALQRAFLQLKTKLEAEGLFNTDRKRLLPKFPQTIGVITSAGGAAFHDIRDTLARRWPSVHVKLYHAAVQGVPSAGELVAGLHYFAQHQPDIVIIGRGGGSLEDLWSFNEEAVARAIFQMPVPVISAVGHETDFSISDFVADVRAATPTQAAMMAVPHQDEIRLRVDDCWLKTHRLVHYKIERLQQKLHLMRSQTGKTALREGLLRRLDRIAQMMQRSKERLKTRLVRHSDAVPALLQRANRNVQQRLVVEQGKVPALKQAAFRAGTFHITRKKHQLQLLGQRLETVNPDSPLEKGFTRIMQDGKWIRRRAQVREDAPVDIVWKDGAQTTSIKA